MSRETSKYVCGEFWLDFRRDGRAKGIWQIARAERGTVIYRSTRTTELEKAKAILDAHLFELRSLGRQEAHEANVIAHMVNYWRERGSGLVNCDQTSRSLRTFAAFLMQDHVGVGAVITDMTPMLIERFRAWRMGAHQFELEWFGETYRYASDGVIGATVQRNINDVRAAIGHAEANLRIPMAPRIPDLDTRYKSEPRLRVLTMDEMARIAWYASYNPPLFRYVALMFATGARPDVALQFNPRMQFDPATGLIDLHPGAAPQTKKRNAQVPAIRPFRHVLRAWARDGAEQVKSRKTAWRVMRRALGLSADVHAKTIRHTIATRLYSDRTVPERETVELMGHEGKLARTTRIYAKYSPHHLGNAMRSLTTLWINVHRLAKVYASDHILTTNKNNAKIIVERTAGNC
jgi:integrase